MALAGAPSTVEEPVTPPTEREGADTRLVGWLQQRATWIFAALLVADLVLLLWFGRGTTFFYDDWDFVVHDYGGGLHSLLLAHVGNISILPIAVYKILFHLVGLSHYIVFRLVVIVLHLVTATLIYVLARRRAQPLTALLAASLILFLGFAWEDLLWGFQIGYMLSITGGVAAWTLLDDPRRRNDVLASLCLIVSATSSSLGIALLIGVAAELVWRRDLRRLWVPAVPVLIYLLWYVGHGESEVTKASLIAAPAFASELAAAAFGALIGHSLDWGRPLAVIAAFGLLWWLGGRSRASARLVGLIATGLSLWIVTAVSRSTISGPETSRYTYLGAVVIVLALVELVRRRVFSPRVSLAACGLVLYFVFCGLTLMSNGAQNLRGISDVMKADLGALELAAAHAPPQFEPDPQRAPQLTAGPYLHTVRSIGSSPADTTKQIVAADPASRNGADNTLVALYGPDIVAAAPTRPSPLAPAPAVLGVTGGSVIQHGRCVQVTPSPGAPANVVVTLPGGAALLRDLGAVGASIYLKRFGDNFVPFPQTLAPHSSRALVIPADSAGIPWQLQLTSSSPTELCGLHP